MQSKAKYVSCGEVLGLTENVVLSRNHSFVMGSARAIACCGRRPRRPHSDTRMRHQLVTELRNDSDRRGAGRNTRGRVCSPLLTAGLRLSSFQGPAAPPTGWLWRARHGHRVITGNGRFVGEAVVGLTNFLLGGKPEPMSLATAKIFGRHRIELREQSVSLAGPLFEIC